MKYSQEVYELAFLINGSIHRALWGEVIPSLRKIILRLTNHSKTAIIDFYHHGEITDAIEEHYSVIVTEVDADYFGRKIEIDHNVIRCDYPNPLPKEEFTVYLRKEPFEDPKD